MAENERTLKIRALMQRANVAERAGQPGLQRRLYELCVELDDGADTDAGNDPSLPPFRLRPYVLFAAALLDDDKADEALAVLAPARERWPYDPDLHMVLGKAHGRAGDWPAAELAYSRSFHLDPQPYTCILIGQALDKQKLHREAVWWLRHSLVVDPDYEESHYNLGCVDFKHGNFVAAERRFRRAIALDPDYADAHYRLADLLLDRALLAPVPRQHRAWAEAIAHLARAVELEPEKTDWAGLLAEMRKPKPTRAMPGAR